MGFRIPTTQETFDRNLSNLESALNQESPLNDKAFLRVLAALEAGNFTQLNRYAANLVLQNFVLTATGEDLDRLGRAFGASLGIDLTRKPATAAELSFTVSCTSGATLPAGTTFISDSTRIVFYSKAAVTQSGATLEVSFTGVSRTLGDAGNLAIGDTATVEVISSLYGTLATVTGSVVTGTEQETDDEYRVRIQDAIRSSGGGGDAYDYRLWAQETPGVVRAFPYSAKPIGMSPWYPGDRTVYIEASSTIDPDGIAPTSLLDSARAYINNDPITGRSRPPLGLTDSTLWVESIVRNPVYVEIRGLSVDASLISEAKALISTNLDLYLRVIEPYVEGIDSPLIRNDTITNLSISDIVQDALSQFAGTADSIGFGLTFGTFILSYQLQQNEKVKLGSVSYA
jgi:uncharacterized phage protein gp47/JayE